MRIQLLILLCLSALPLCLAQEIDVRVLIRDIAIQTNSQQGGSIQFVFSEDPIYSASPESPLYLRILFDKNVVLCQTRVWTNEANPDPVTRMPIYLPVEVLSQVFDPENTLNPDSADAISIVRWKAGESSIWIKITQPARNFVTGPLSQNIEFEFGLGRSAKFYWQQYELLFLNHEATLPTSTRDPSDPLAITEADSISTLLCMDYRQSTQTASPWNPETQTFGTFDVYLFDGTTRGVDGPQAASNEADIVSGEAFRTRFSTQNPISKGRNPTCPTTPSDEDTVIGESSLCNQGLLSFSSRRVFQVSCTDRWGFYTGSQAIVTLSDDDAQHGFRVQTDTQGNPLADAQGRIRLYDEDFVFGFATSPLPYAYCDPDDLFLATGDHWFTRQATLVYGGFTALSSFNLTVGTTVFQEASAGSSAAIATIQLRVGDKEPLAFIDDPPFDNPQEQHRRCPVSYREVTIPGGLLLGEFTACGPGGKR